MTEATSGRGLTLLGTRLPCPEFIDEADSPCGLWKDHDGPHGHRSRGTWVFYGTADQPTPGCLCCGLLAARGYPTLCGDCASAPARNDR